MTRRMLPIRSMWLRGFAIPSRGIVVALGFVSAGISVVPAFWILPVLALALLAVSHRLPAMRKRASTKFIGAVIVLVSISVFPRGAMSLAFVDHLRPTSLALAGGGLATVLLVMKNPLRNLRMTRAAWWLVAAWVVGSSVVVIIVDADPWIDVWHLHQQAGEALATGANPYSDLDLPNPMPWFPEGSKFEGYTYPPVSLFTYGATAAILGESRWVVVCIGAALVYTLRRLSSNPTTDMLAVLLLLTPGWVLMAQLAWTEPVSLLFLAVGLLASPRARPYLMGLFIASKQYLILFLPSLVLAWIRRKLTGVAIAIGAAVALFAIGAIYGLDAYLEWAFLFHTAAPNAELGASIPGLAWMLYQVELGIPLALKGVAALVVAALTSRLDTQSDGAMVLSGVLTVGTFFVLSTQSFPNYWYLILGGIVLAILKLNAEESVTQARAHLPDEPNAV